MIGEGQMLIWHRLQKKIHSTSYTLLRICSEDTASCLTLRLAKRWLSAQDFTKTAGRCWIFLCKFCLDYLMRFFSKANKDWHLHYILRAFWHVMRQLTIIWLDYWSKSGKCEEQERNSIYIVVLHENVELSSQISSNIN